MKTIIADTNTFLRFLLHDVPSQTKEITSLFTRAQKGEIKLVVPDIVVFEMMFALEKYYGYAKTDAVEKLTALVSTSSFEIVSRHAFLDALSTYAVTGLSFVDCFLLAICVQTNTQLFTFDKRLAKHLKSRVTEKV